MQRYVYPAIFYKDDNIYRVYFPDIQLATDGAFMEEAFLYAKEFLKSYFIQVNKNDFDFNYPTEYEKIKSTCKNDDVVMLIDATVTKKDITK